MRIEKQTFTETLPPPRSLTENLKARKLPINETLEQARQRAELNFAQRLKERVTRVNPTENLGQGTRNEQEKAPENEAKRLAQLKALQERIEKARLNSR